MKKIIISLISLSVISCSQVETGEVGIKTTFGKVSDEALSPGIYGFIPGISSIHKLITRIQTVEQDSVAASKDLQSVSTQLTLNYHLGTQNPIEHFIRLGSQQELIENSIVKPAMSETFKAVVAQFNAEELITKREIVSNLIVSTLNGKLKQYDLFVDSISITGFAFSKAYTEAIEAKQVAEQNANKAKNDLQRIQVEAQQKIVEAQAQAKAMELQKSVVSPELVQLKQLDIQAKLIEKWNGELPQYVGNNNPMSVLNVGK